MKGERAVTWTLHLENTGKDKIDYLTCLIKIKLLKEDGSDLVIIRHDGKYKIGVDTLEVQTLHSFLQKPDAGFMPGGQVTICAEFQILYVYKSGLQASCPAVSKGSSLMVVDIHKEMCDNFVDIGPSSVLLVFEDGELHSHTFPLAAR
jgi:hypothetical protein